MQNEPNLLDDLKKRLLAVIDEYKTNFGKNKPANAKPANGETKPAETKPANGETKTAETKPANGAATPVVASKTLSASVGEGGTNKPEDVALVKGLINKFAKAFDPKDIPNWSKVGATTIKVIKEFQQKKVGLSTPDGRIDVGGKTWQVLSGATPPTTNITQPTTSNGQQLSPAEQKDAYAKIAAQYGLEPAVVFAIQNTETGGNGYLDDGRVKILFERHAFWDELKAAGLDPNQYTSGNEDILAYNPTPPGGYGSEKGQYARLERAMKINKSAALKAASWGEFQIMGYNHKNAGYPDVESFVEAMKVKGSLNNIKAMLSFAKSEGILKYVQGPNKDWAGFAKRYNGPAYQQNQYDKKLAAAYASYK